MEGERGGKRPAVLRRRSRGDLRGKGEVGDSDTEEEGEHDDDDAADRKKARRGKQRSPAEALHFIDKEFARLLPFITAGLRSVGRVGAEPLWEQFAERLEWESKRERH